MHLRTFLLNPIVVILLLASAAPTRAQTTETRPSGWIFLPTMTFSGGWDDNVLLVGLDEGKPADYVTALGPGGSLEYRGPRTDLFAGYNGSFVLYRDLSELNSIDQHARARLQYRATRYTTVIVGQSFASSPTTDGIELVGVPFRRIGNWTTTTNGGVETRLTPRLTVRGGYELRVVDFDDEAEAFLAFPGGHEHYVSGGLDHRLTPRLTVGASYDLRRVNVTGGVEVVSVQQSSGTVEYSAAPPVTLFASAGVSHLGAGPGREARIGPAWRAGIAARLRRTDLTASYQRSVVPSFGFGGTFHNEEIVGSARTAFAHNRAYWQGTVAWRDNDPLIVGPPSTRTLWLSSAVGYYLARWMRIEGYYSNSRQDTQRPGGKIDRNRVGFQLVTSKPIRLNQ